MCSVLLESLQLFIHWFRAIHELSGCDLSNDAVAQAEAVAHGEIHVMLRVVTQPVLLHEEVVAK